MKKTGTVLIASFVFIFLVERLTLVFSDFLGKLSCGERYLQPVEGGVPCGFNSDMHLAAFLVVVLIVGIVLFNSRKS